MRISSAADQLRFKLLLPEVSLWSLLGVLVKTNVITALMKHHAQRQPGEERVDLSLQLLGHTQTPREVRASTQGRG